MDQQDSKHGQLARMANKDSSYMTGKERSSRVGVLGDLMPSLFHGNLAKHLHIIIYKKKKKR